MGRRRAGRTASSIRRAAVLVSCGCSRSALPSLSRVECGERRRGHDPAAWSRVFWCSGPCARRTSPGTGAPAANAKRPTWHEAQVGRSLRDAGGAGVLPCGARPSRGLAAPAREAPRPLRSWACARGGRQARDGAGCARERPVGPGGRESHLGDTRPVRPRGDEVGQCALRHRRQRRAPGPGPDARVCRAAPWALDAARAAEAHGLGGRVGHEEIAGAKGWMCESRIADAIGQPARLDEAPAAHAGAASSVCIGTRLPARNLAPNRGVSTGGGPADVLTDEAPSVPDPSDTLPW